MSACFMLIEAAIKAHGLRGDNILLVELIDGFKQAFEQVVLFIGRELRYTIIHVPAFLLLLVAG